jgi:hypothetical protein
MNVNLLRDSNSNSLRFGIKTLKAMDLYSVRSHLESQTRLLAVFTGI